MVKNNGIPFEVKKPVETVQELKNEYQVLSFEEFMKNYESDDKVVESYDGELEAKVVQGPQYGPGKSDFSGLCRRIRSDLIPKFSKITARISCDSDYYRGDNYDYAGAVIYAIDGKFTWRNTAGEAANRNGRSFYIIIKCTDNWGQSQFKSRGSGVVHSHLIENALGFDMGSSSDAYKVCASGFAWRKGSRELRFNSHPLNGTSQNSGTSDGSDTLSYYERKLVEFFWEKYKQSGPDSTFDIPSYLLP